jgi:hypothetical protein
LPVNKILEFTKKKNPPNNPPSVAEHGMKTQFRGQLEHIDQAREINTAHIFIISTLQA